MATPDGGHAGGEYEMYQLLNLTRTPNPTHQAHIVCDGCGATLSRFHDPRATDYGYERGYAWHYCYTSDNGPRPRPTKEGSRG